MMIKMGIKELKMKMQKKCEAGGEVMWRNQTRVVLYHYY